MAGKKGRQQRGTSAHANGEGRQARGDQQQPLMANNNNNGRRSRQKRHQSQPATGNRPVPAKNSLQSAQNGTQSHGNLVGPNKRIFHETWEQYARITFPYILHQLGGANKSTGWIYEILERKREADRIILDDPHPTEGFLLSPTLSWEQRGFPMDRFYLLAFVNRRDILTIRDLTNAHLPLLLNMRNKIGQFVRQYYGLDGNQICMFFHYHPTAFHLHLHICLKKRVDYSVPRNVYLREVISNLTKNGMFYREASLPIYLHRGMKLFREFADEQLEQDIENYLQLDMENGDDENDEDEEEEEQQEEENSGGCCPGCVIS